MKIWMAILAVTATVILCLWLFQAFLLEQLYLSNKEEQMVEDTKHIVSLINDPDISANQLQSEFTRICYENNYSIELYDLISQYDQTVAPRGSKNLLADAGFNRQKLLLEMSMTAPGEYVKKRVQSEFDNEFYLVASHQSNGQYSYIILVASALAPVSEAVDSTKTQLVYISIALIVLATAAAFVLARSLTKPIVQISKAAQEIAKGNLDVQVSVKSKDELGQLSNDFNRMAKEIARSSTLQRELVANVSHDIRTPLTMIKGYAETIKDLTGDIKEKREQQLDVIIAESNRLNVLVNDILDLSKLQAGQQKLTYQEFDLAQKLRDVMKRYDLLTMNEGFQFTLDVPEHPVLVYADEVKMEQVIYNIINNATNHTGADKRVTVTLKDGKEHAVVEIADTGAGIKPEDIPLIWDRYYKPYKKNDRKGMGTGLGLSIVKAILVAHQFDYGVNSVVGQGSTFWFEVKKKTEQIAN